MVAAKEAVLQTNIDPRSDCRNYAFKHSLIIKHILKGDFVLSCLVYRLHIFNLKVELCDL